MVRAVIVLVLGLFVLSLAETKSSKEIEYIGRWVGDPTKLLENLGFLIIPGGADVRFCTFGGPNASTFIDKAIECVESFIKNAKDMCDFKGVTHYAIANLRMSQSNAINSYGTYKNYGHFLIVYGDVLCAIKVKK